MEHCSGCGNERDRPGQKYCLKCHAAYMRRWRPKHSDLTPEQRRKANCRAYANVYLNRGKLEKLPCEKCGDPESQMHHDDYSKPLDVTWLCRPCHLELHQDDG